MARIRLPQRHIPYELKTLKAAELDLLTIRQTDGRTYARLVALISELQSDQEQLAHLLQDHYGQAPDDWQTHSFGVRYIGEFSRHTPKRELWRLRAWDL